MALNDPPAPFYTDGQVVLHQGDCLNVMRGLADNSVDAIVTDPPYGLGFMGKEWDSSFEPADMPMRRNGAQDAVNAGAARQGGRQRAGLGYQRRMARDSRDYGAWCQAWATEALRVLKPGAHMLAFGGTRTWHRLATAVEDAGFEIRDNIAWLYGSGFPKSLDVSKAIDKAAGAERDEGFPGRYAARRPRAEVLAVNAYQDGVGNASSAMVTEPATDAARRWQGWGTALKPAYEPIIVARKPLTGTVAGNIQQWGTGALNIDATRIGTSGGGNACAGGDDCQCVTSGVTYSPTKHPLRREGEFGRWPANVVLDEHTAALLDQQSGTTSSSVRKPTGRDTRGIPNGSTPVIRVADTIERGTIDSGGASRFYYTAKAPTHQRPTDPVDGTGHPTVKPLDLIRWLTRLVTPPGGLILDPFLGSGTTAEACIIEHFRCIGIDQDLASCRRAVQRLSKPIEPVLDFGGGAA